MQTKTENKASPSPTVKRGNNLSNALQGEKRGRKERVFIIVDDFTDPAGPYVPYGSVRGMVRGDHRAAVTLLEHIKKDYPDVVLIEIPAENVELSAGEEDLAAVLHVIGPRPEFRRVLPPV